MKLPNLVLWSQRPEKYQRQSALMSAKRTVIITYKKPQWPKRPRKARIKVEKAAAFPMMIVEK